MVMYRLRSSAFGRPEEIKRINPKRIVFLSVEGDVTERNYFSRLNEHLDHSVIHVEVLSRKKGSGYNDPDSVIELLREYFLLRDENILPDEAKEMIGKNYLDIEEYLNSPQKLDKKRCNEIQADLLKLGIDIEYRKYLHRLAVNRNTDMDIFGVVIDRDCKCHSRELMEACINKCNILGVGCYISNPCFEFWLLLHVCDVKTEYSVEQLEELLRNPKVTNHHTAISREISIRCKHAKGISIGTFNKIYWPNVPEAIKRSKEFSCDCLELLDSLGSNVSILLEKMDI